MSDTSFVSARLWHYTTGDAVPQIMRDALISQSPEIRHDSIRIPPLTWLTSAPVCELCCRACAELGIDEIDDLYDAPGHGAVGTLVRIGVNAAGAYRWDVLLSDWSVPQWLLFHMAATGLEAGADPEQWYVRPNAIPRSQWRTVQQWDGTRWTDLSTNERRFTRED